MMQIHHALHVGSTHVPVGRSCSTKGNRGSSLKLIMGWMGRQIGRRSTLHAGVG